MTSQSRSSKNLMTNRVARPTSSRLPRPRFPPRLPLPLIKDRPPPRKGVGPSVVPLAGIKAPVFMLPFNLGLPSQTPVSFTALFPQTTGDGGGEDSQREDVGGTNFSKRKNVEFPSRRYSPQHHVGGLEAGIPHGANMRCLLPFSRNYGKVPSKAYRTSNPWVAEKEHRTRDPFPPGSVLFKAFYPNQKER